MKQNLTTKDLLEYGFNMLADKPFGRNYYECMDLCKTAKENNVVAAFHQSLFNPAHLKNKEIIRSCKLGDVIQISMKYSGFTRCWDW